jgi:hypothetical protein
VTTSNLHSTFPPSAEASSTGAGAGVAQAEMSNSAATPPMDFFT